MVWPMKKKQRAGKAATTTGDVPVSHGTESTRVRPGKLFMLLLPLLLILTIGASVAPVAGEGKGWAYYRHNNIMYQAPGPQFPGSQQLRIFAGWRWGTNTIQQLLHRQAPTMVPDRTYNQEIKKAGQIVPAICIAWLLLSALVAALYLLVWLLSSCFHVATMKKTKTSKPRSPFISSLLWPLLGTILGLGCIGLSIASYIVIAVGISIYTRQNLGNRVYIAWPSWCFYVGCAAGLFWLITSLLAMAEAAKARKRRKAALAVYKHQRTGDVDERRAAPFYEDKNTAPHANGTAPVVHHNNTYAPGHGDVENGIGNGNRDIATWSTVGPKPLAHGPTPTIVERI